MRVGALAAAMALCSACVRPIPLTPYEQCASNGLVVDRVGFQSETGTAVAYGSRETAFASAEGYGQSVACRRPDTIQERCELAAAGASLNVKLAYDPFWRNAFIGLGYVAFIVPGVVLSIGFVVGRGGVKDDATHAAFTTLQSCLNPSGELPVRNASYCYDVFGQLGAGRDCSDSLEACNAKRELAISRGLGAMSCEQQ